MSELKFENPYGRANYGAVGIYDVVRSEIANAPSYYAGELETLVEKLDKVVEILAFMSTYLGAEEQKALADKLYWSVSK